TGRTDRNAVNHDPVMSRIAPEKGVTDGFAVDPYAARGDKIPRLRTGTVSKLGEGTREAYLCIISRNLHSKKKAQSLAGLSRKSGIGIPSGTDSIELRKEEMIVVIMHEKERKNNDVITLVEAQAQGVTIDQKQGYHTDCAHRTQNVKTVE